ncbi:MAG: MXAN_6640 family putative metalloprotease [Candidatus Kapaibacteriota bacterium]
MFSPKYLLLLLITLVFPYPSYSHEDIKCLTFPIRKSQKLQDKILSSVKFDSTGRPINQCVAFSQNGLFAVHYDTAGQNKVPHYDLDLNGIPDYVDSALFYLEKAYYIYCDSMGFEPPPIDSGRGGNNSYDFYLFDIGNGYYEEVAYGWTVPDVEIKVPSRYPKYACFSVIDNDFSPFDTTFFPSGNKRATFRETGYLGLKITIAHELHHLFQFGYGDPMFPSFNEMTSTFMEFRLNPESKDYLQYVKSLFSDFSKYILSDPSYYVGYRYAIFLQYLHLKHGDFPVVELWKNIGRGNDPLLSLELALNQKGSMISKELAGFLPYLFYTGKNSKLNLLPNSNLYPDISYLFQDNLDKVLVTSQRLKPFEIRPMRIFMLSDVPEALDDTLYIFLANLDSKNALSQNLDSVGECTIIVSKEDQSGIKLHPKEIYYKFIGDRNKFADSLFLSFGFKTYAVSFPFPNPWKFRESGISFPVPSEATIKDDVELRIFDSNLTEIRLPNNNFNVSIRKQKRVIHFDHFPVDLPTGIYFFKVSFKGKEIFGKFSVVN